MSTPPVFPLIAEIGSVHDGSFGNACHLIDAAATCGADAVKFQTHIAEAESLPNAPSPTYFSAEDRIDYFNRTSFSQEQWIDLSERAAAAKVAFISSAFSLEAVDLLERVGVDAHKVPSGEVTNVPLLERLAETGKPVYLSSGMSTWSELDMAVDVLREGGPLVVMQCASRYPCPPEEVGLNVISLMAERYGVPIGFSDHSLGPEMAIAATALGAETVEKHFTFSTLMYGSDAMHSMEPGEFARFARMLSEVRRAVATQVDKDAAATELSDMKRIFEKSVVAAHDLEASSTLDRADLAFKKPGDGHPAGRYRELIGRRLVRRVPADHMFTDGDFQ